MDGNNNILGVETKNLSKQFGKLTAVKNVNLRIKKGEIYSLIGENGAGKTTLMKCIVGLLAYTSGEVTINGFNIIKQPLEAKKQFGFVPDDPSVYDYLTGIEFLELTANLRGIKKDEITSTIKRLIKLFPIEEILYQQMSSYSRGNRQKLAFLGALISSPPILFIDEPVAGLDPKSMEIFGNTIKSYAKAGNSIFFISHSLPFAQNYADRVGLMQKGVIVKETEIRKISNLSHFYGNV